MTSKKILAFLLSPIMVVAGLGGLVVTQTGCNSATFMADVSKLSPAITNALRIYGTATGNQIALSLASKIDGDEPTVQKLYADFEAAVKSGNAQQQAQAWTYLNAAFTVFEEDASQAFTLMSGLIPGPIQAEITAMVAAAQVLLAVIESLMPAPPAGVSGQKAARFASKLPASFNLGDFVKNHNKLLSLKTGVPDVDAVKAKLPRLHVNNLFVRTVSLHFAK
jgi:hypothetical protein